MLTKLSLPDDLCVGVLILNFTSSFCVYCLASHWAQCLNSVIFVKDPLGTFIKEKALVLRAFSRNCKTSRRGSFAALVNTRHSLTPTPATLTRKICWEEVKTCWRRKWWCFYGWKSFNITILVCDSNMSCVTPGWWWEETGAEEWILLPFKGLFDIEEILCNFLHPSIKPPTIDKTFVPINKLLYNNHGIWIFSISQNNGEETNEIWIF